MYSVAVLWENNTQLEARRMMHINIYSMWYNRTVYAIYISLLIKPPKPFCRTAMTSYSFMCQFYVTYLNLSCKTKNINGVFLFYLLIQIWCRTGYTFWSITEHLVFSIISKQCIVCALRVYCERSCWQDQSIKALFSNFTGSSLQCDCSCILPIFLLFVSLQYMTVMF